MSSDRHDCPKCGRRMERGYIVDGRHAERRYVTEWVEGAPEKSFWTGLKISNRRVLQVTVYRCEKCGFLEAYAFQPT